MRKAFVDTLLDLAAADPAVMLVSGDLGFGVFEPYITRCPGQFLNAGLTEQAMTSLAAGLALEGRRVFTYSIGNFPSLRALEQLRNDVAYHQLSVTAVSVGAGFAYGSAGVTHHATEDLTAVRALPNVTVFSPGCPVEASAATRAAYALGGPAYLRLGKGGEPPLHDRLPADIFHIQPLREGQDICVLATGAIAEQALAAADLLALQGVSVSVCSVPTVKPLDAKTLSCLAKGHRHIVTVEEHNLSGGFGSAVLEALSDLNQTIPVTRIGIPDCYADVAGSQQYLRQRYGIDAEAIAARIQSLLS